MTKLEQIKQSLSEITQGEWYKAEIDGHVFVKRDKKPDGIAITYVDWSKDENKQQSIIDAKFIAQAPKNIRYLIGEVERLRGALEAIRDMPDYDQDNEHRLRYIAKQALKQEEGQ